MEYRATPPPPDLAPWVECAWCLRGAIAPLGQVILPDGRLELIFHFGGTPIVERVRQPNALIAGRMLRGLELQPNGVMDALGVRLRPDASACLMPSDLLGPVESMEAVAGTWARETRERLANCSGEQDRIETVWMLLRSRIGGRARPDAAVAYSIGVMEAAFGLGAVESFVPPGLGIRQWQRRFLKVTGFSPKAFARITRMQRLIALCEADDRGKWVDLALEAGFYDQAHLANEIRAFTGQGPEAYIRGGRGMTEFYRDGFFQDGKRRRGYASEHE